MAVRAVAHRPPGAQALRLWMPAAATKSLVPGSPGPRPAKASPHKVLLKAEALQQAVLTSPRFSIIATDEQGIIQLFNVGAERMLGYAAAEVVNRISPSDIHDPAEVLA